MRTLGRVPQIENQWVYASNTSPLNDIATCQQQILFTKKTGKQPRSTTVPRKPHTNAFLLHNLILFYRSTMCLNWFVKLTKPRQTCWPTVDYGEYKMNSTKFNLVSARQVVADSENLHPMKRHETPMDGDKMWSMIMTTWTIWKDNVHLLSGRWLMPIANSYQFSWRCVTLSLDSIPVDRSFGHGWQHYVVTIDGFGWGSQGAAIFLRAQCIAKKMYRADELNNKASKIRCYRSLISPLRQHRGTVNEQWKKDWMIRGTYWQSMQSTRF